MEDFVCKRGHRNDYVVKNDGARRCKPCAREYQKTYKANKRAIKSQGGLTMGKQWKVITPEQFNLAKIMSKAGINNRLIGEAVDKSATTVGRMMKYDTLDEYHRAEREARYAYKDAKKAAEVPSVELPPIEPVVSWNPFARKTVTEEAKAEVLSAPEEETNNDVLLDYKLLNENLVLLAKSMEKYSNSCEALAISVYALRKTVNGK